MPFPEPPVVLPEVPVHGSLPTLPAMRSSVSRILNSLTFRTVAPIVVIALLAWISLYIFVLRSVSLFAEEQIRSSFVEMAHDVYLLCDREFSDLLQSGSLNEERSVRVRKARALGYISEFIRQNSLQGAVFSRGSSLLLSEQAPAGTISAALAAGSDAPIRSFAFAGRAYYGYQISFEPWDWDIILVRDSAEYSALMQSVRIAYGVTGFILAVATFLFIYTLRRNIRKPLDDILTPLKKGVKPSYHDITEFRYLSDSIASAMALHEKEGLMLNNLYHIAAVKRGDDFFDEVAMAISRLFGMNASISRLLPDGRSERIVSLYLNGAIRKNIIVELQGTPCEDVVTRKHISVINAGVRELFPKVQLLADTGAEAFIGLAIFNRKSDVIGVINAFGAAREFSEADIKVLQTIGEIAASEFERLDEEKEKDQMREQLFQAHKMEAIGTLAGGIAHDFNNMLQGILGHASLLKAQVSTDHELYESVDTIEHIAERAAQLTGQLLGFARKGKYVVEPLNVNDIISNVMKIISKTFDRKIEIKKYAAEGLWSIEGDRSQIEQVIMNLCLNARDAMPDGGTLTIETFNRRSPAEPQQGADGEADQGEVVIRISDTGLGIPADIRDHIFEPFFTTKEIGKGTGMGLAMAYGVVKNHNGTIHVSSAPGHGTSFTISFPAAAPCELSEHAGPELISGGKGTILIVDDEEFIRTILQTMLEKLGYTVLLAGDGKEALDLYAAEKDRIDLVILDLIMPVMSGRETYDRLLKLNRNVRVLIASGHMTPGQVTFLDPNVRHAFIQKPFKMSDIAARVKSLLSV